MPDEMVIFTRTTIFFPAAALTMHFPRSQRFVVTGRLQTAALNFQEQIIEANAQRRRKTRTKNCAPRCRAAQNPPVPAPVRALAVAEPGQYRHASRLVAEMGPVRRLLKTVTPGQ